MLVFISWILTHRWAIPVALCASLVLGIWFVKTQNNHLRAELESTQSDLVTATATAMANAEAIKKMVVFQARQEIEIKKAADQAIAATQLIEETKRKTRSARKTIGDAPIAPVVRDGLDILYGPAKPAPEGGSPQPAH